MTIVSKTSIKSTNFSCSQSLFNCPDIKIHGHLFTWYLILEDILFHQYTAITGSPSVLVMLLNYKNPCENVKRSELNLAMTYYLVLVETLRWRSGESLRSLGHCFKRSFVLPRVEIEILSVNRYLAIFQPSSFEAFWFALAIRLYCWPSAVH